VDSRKHLQRIAKQLRKDRFCFQPGQGTPVTRSGKKHRPLVKAPIEARIVQRALLDVLQDEPALKQYFLIETSFGGIKDRSVENAIEAAYDAMHNGAAYFLRSDIHDFFQNIPRQRPLATIASIIHDDRFNLLLNRATITELDNLVELGRHADLYPTYEIGVAQGCSLSPLLGNILLYDFDTRMNGRGIACLRYIDDFIILGPEPKRVLKAFDSAQAILAQYNLQAYDPRTRCEKAEIGPTARGLDFLGCDIRPGLISPNKAARKRLLAKVEEIFKESRVLMPHPKRIARQRKSVKDTLNEVDNLARGWGNQYSFCNDGHLWKWLDQEIDKRIAKYLRSYSRTQKRFAQNNDSYSRRRLLGVHLLADSKSAPIIRRS